MKVNCKCGAAYNVKFQLIGKKVKCKKCGQGFVVPAPNSAGLVPATDSKRPAQKKDMSAAKEKAAREKALLDKMIDPEAKQKKTLEERIRERRADSVEQMRVSHGINGIVLGTIGLLLAIGTFVMFFLYPKGGEATPIPVTILHYIEAQWWLGVLFLVFAAYQLTMGIGSLTRMIDIEKERSGI